MTGQSRKQHPGGSDAEQQALLWLQRRGLKAVAQNFNCRSGEVDLIGIDDDTLAFIEVRYRGDGTRGSAAESIDRRKQQKIITAARYFLHNNARYNNMPCRFDAVLSDHRDSAGQYVFEWCKHAFTAD